LRMVEAPSTRETSEVIAKLIKLDESKPAPTTKPKLLQLRDIKEVPEVLQPRTSSLMYAQRQSQEHVKVLVAAIKRRKKPLDPITVVSFGDKWFALDGHHRLEAYRIAKWKAPVPVTVAALKRKGAKRVQEAMALSAASNVKDKLPMSRDDKLDVAWRLTALFPDMPKGQVAETASVSTATIANMRKALRALLNPAETNRDDLAGKQWRIARMRWEQKLGKEVDQSSSAQDERNITLIVKGLKDVIWKATGWQLVLALERTQPHLLEELEEALQRRKDYGAGELPEL
jgi:ParB-like chromosome segregation protein Spo0J